jgi:hypothetical protein
MLFVKARLKMKKIFSFLSLSALFLLLAQPSFAQEGLTTCGYKAADGQYVTTLNCIFPLLDSFLWWGIMLGSSVAVFVIIIAGLRFMVSGGDPKKVQQAQKTFVYAIAALLLMYLAFFIINVIGYITGATCVSISSTTVFKFDMCR